MQLSCHVSISWDAAIAIALSAAALLYAAAVSRVWRAAGIGRGTRWREVACVAAGWLVLVVALQSPLDALSDVLFAAHMTQHELLMLVAAPLIVLGRPLVTVLWLLPRSTRRRVQRAQRPSVMRVWWWLTAPLTVLLIHGLVVWIWHVPVLFEAAMASESVHAFQHLLFFWSAALFWWALVHGRYGRLGYGVSVIFVFATAMHTGILGALLTFSPHVWYPTYAGRAATYEGGSLADQQLAGLLMWIPAGALFLVIGLALFGAWIGEAGRRERIVRQTEDRLDTAGKDELATR